MIQPKTQTLSSLFGNVLILMMLSYQTSLTAQPEILGTEIPYHSETINLQKFGCSLPLTCQLPETAFIQEFGDLSYILKLKSGVLLGLEKIDKRDLIIGSGAYNVRTAESMLKEEIEDIYVKRYKNTYDIHLVESNGVVLQHKKTKSKIVSYFLSDKEAVYKIKIPPIASVGDEDYEKCLKIIHSIAVAERCFQKSNFTITNKDTIVDLTDKHFPLQLVLPKGSDVKNGEGFYRGDIVVEVKKGKKIIIAQEEKAKAAKLIEEKKTKAKNEANFIRFLKETESGFLAEFDSDSANEKYQLFYAKTSSNYTYTFKVYFSNYVKVKQQPVSQTYIEDWFKRIELSNVALVCE